MMMMYQILKRLSALPIIIQNPKNRLQLVQKFTKMKILTAEDPRSHNRRRETYFSSIRQIFLQRARNRVIVQIQWLKSK